jgi:hypothetical protein
MTHTFRPILTLGLSVLLLALTACDSNDPAVTDEPAGDLFLLQPTYFASMNFPTGGRGPVRTLPVATTDLSFTVASDAFDQAPVTTPARPVNLLSALTGAGYSAQSVYDVRVRDYATLRIEAPAGATLDFLSNVEVVFSADGLPDQVVGGQSYLYGSTADVYIESYFAREYLLRPGFEVRLVLDPYGTPEAVGTYRFGFDFDVDIQVYDGDPAPSEVTFERELYLRDALRYERYDVGDVVSARVTNVALIDPYGSAASSSLDDRLDTARILIGSTETREMEEAAVLDAFAERPHSQFGTGYGASAEIDHDMTAEVRRTGAIRVEGVLELDEAAAARGEYYEAYLEVEVAFEVPIPHGDRTDGEGRTAELRVPMRVPVAARATTEG